MRRYPTYPKDPSILPHRRISLTIPKRFLKKLLKSDSFLTPRERVKLKQKLNQIDLAINRLRHAQSVVEKIYRRKPHDTTVS